MYFNDLAKRIFTEPLKFNKNGKSTQKFWYIGLAKL